jgi:ribosomal protein L28
MIDFKIMSRVCSICGKGSIVTVTRKKLRSKYNPTTKKRKYPNLQWVKLDNNKRVKACAKCIKIMGKKQRAIV